MPRRWGINTRLWAYRYLVIRDGEQCARCFETPTAQNTLDIDHIDGFSQNNDPDNLRLLCRSCNVALGNSARGSSDHLVRVRERKEGKASTRVAREVVKYQEGSQEMQANFLFELDFRVWLLERIRTLGEFPRADAITAGAELVGCSPATTARYLSKLTSSAGPLQESRDMLGGIILQLKDHLKPEETILVDLDRLQSVRTESARQAPGNHEPRT
jgi:hypothetical protein